MHDYAHFMAALCNEEKLKHLDVAAVARIIEHGSRLADDQQKLSTRFGEIADVIREANYYAVQDDATYVMEGHVRRAIEGRFYRSRLIQERIQENQLINDIRGRVAQWRQGSYLGVTPTTSRLLAYWTNPDREKKLFFCQIEALDTIIYLTEVAQRSGDAWIANALRDGNAQSPIMKLQHSLKKRSRILLISITSGT